MRIKIYIKLEEFLCNKVQLRVRKIKISLCRTYLFSKKNDKAIYYRKYISPRKLFVSANPKEISGININVHREIPSKYKIKIIDKLLLEYISPLGINVKSTFESFDIAKYVDKVSYADSYEENGVVTMNFDDAKENPKRNMLWINIYNRSNNNCYYKNV